MIKQFMIVSSLIFFVSVQPTLAGTWRDDFEDGDLNGWKVIYNRDTTEWDVEDGKLSARFKVRGEVADGSSISMEPAEWRDYTLEASVELVQKLGGHTEMGFGVRTDPSNGRCYTFVLHFVDNNLEINRHTSWFGYQKLKIEPYAISEDTWYRLKCSILGDHLSFYIDDELCAEVDAEEPVFKDGTVAIYVLNVHMLIDDIVITGDDVPDGGSVQMGEEVEPGGKLAATWGGIKFHASNG
jgi:hypothetical protein